MDKARVKQRFRKAGAHYAQQAQVQQQMALQLWEYAQQAQVQPQQLLEIGCGQGAFTQYLQGWDGLQSVVLNDLYLPKAALQALCGETVSVQWLEGDIESLPLPQGLDTVVSAAALQWLADVPSLLRKLHASLRVDGHVVFSTFGPQQYSEIRHLTGQGLRYFTVAQWQAMLSVDFELLLVEEDSVCLWFDSPWDVLKHLQRTGVTGTGQWQWNKARLRDFTQQYQQQFGQQDGTAVPLSYHPIYLIARKKHG